MTDSSFRSPNQTIRPKALAATTSVERPHATSDSHRLFALAELRSQFLVRHATRVGTKIPIEDVEQLGLSATRVSVSYVVDDTFKQRERPAPIVDCFWGQRMRQLELIVDVDVLGVDRHDRHSAPRFTAACRRHSLARKFFGARCAGSCEIVSARGQRSSGRASRAAQRRRPGESVGVLDVISAPTHVGRQRIPVVRAQRGRPARMDRHRSPTSGSSVSSRTGADRWCLHREASRTSSPW